MDDPPPMRYGLWDDEHPHFVCFASLMEVAVGYDTPNAAIEFQQDHGPSNDHLQGRNFRGRTKKGAGCMNQLDWNLRGPYRCGAPAVP